MKLYINKEDNLEEMNTFLETYGFPRLMNKVIQNMLSLITNKQIEILIKKTLKKKERKKTQDQKATLMNSATFSRKA